MALKLYKVLQSNKEREDFLEEAKLMLQYRHRNVVRLYGVVADKLPLMLVLEHCVSGGLDECLKKNKGKIETSDKVRFCVEAARGLEYLGIKKNIVHRDLAARNCLIGYGLDLKVSDFGLM